MSTLNGTTVVSLEQAVAAPLATRHLADLGARVIKIERPGGGDFARHYDSRARGLSSHFVWLNRGKESLTLNLKSDPGRSILEQLVGRADMFVHNLAPGAVERLGFDAPRLRQSYPGLIIGQISGYGRDGPFRDRKAYDLLIQAEAGLLAITGAPEAPAKAGIAVADIAAGATLTSALLAALVGRFKTGRGTFIEISMLEALAEWMGYPAYYALGGAAPPRTGADHATIAPYGPFSAGDGRQVVLSVQNQREWRRFCAQVLEQPDLADDPRFAGNEARVTHRPALRAAIDAVFSRLSADELTTRLDAAGIAYGAIRGAEELWRHPQLVARGRPGTMASPAGPLPALIPPAAPGGSALSGAIPALGEHTDRILAELGHDQAEIARWRGEGVV